MPTFIQTVTGPVAADELGITYSHEHLVAYATPDLVWEDPDLALDDPDRVRPELRMFRGLGGRTIVELTTVDYGRDVQALQQLARDTSVQIVAATGFNKGIYCRPFTEGRSVAEVAAEQVQEITDGVADTGIRAGVVKAGTSLDRIEPWEEVALRAAARTHKATGCPVITHTEAGTMTEEQLAILRTEGVATDNIILCHLDRNPDLILHRRLAQAGAFLSYDQIPKPKYKTEAAVIDLIVTLAHEGLHTQLLIGGDFARRSYFKGWGGQPGLDYLLTAFRPRLEQSLAEQGLPAETIMHDLFVANPARAFQFRSSS